MLAGTAPGHGIAAAVQGDGSIATGSTILFTLWPGHPSGHVAGGVRSGAERGAHCGHGV
jgi:hypothetical protein